MSANLKWGTKPGNMAVFSPGVWLNSAAARACTNAWVGDVNKRQAEREAERALKKSKAEGRGKGGPRKYTREQVLCAKVWSREAGLHSAYISRRLNVPESTVNQWVTELTCVRVKPTPEETALFLSQL